MISFDAKVRVWYKHTDQMGICHHSNYICYFESARSDMMRSLGLSYAEMEARGVMMPILEVQSRYRKPAYYDEVLTIRVRIEEMPVTRIDFRYEIFNEAQELLNTGWTQLGFMDSTTRRPCRCPEWVLEKLREHWVEPTPNA